MLLSPLIAAVECRTLADDPVTIAAVAGISMPQCRFAILCGLFFALYFGWPSAATGRTPS